MYCAFVFLNFFKKGSRELKKEVIHTREDFGHWREERRSIREEREKEKEEKEREEERERERGLEEGRNHLTFRKLGGRREKNEERKE